MKQRIHYVPANDGVRLAWAEIGRGPGLVKAATWLTHLQDDLDSPIWSHWVRFFGEHFRYVRYDERGCGMSDWQAGDLAQQHWVGALENVVDAAGLAAPFALLGISKGRAPASRHELPHHDHVLLTLLSGGDTVDG